MYNTSLTFFGAVEWDSLGVLETLMFRICDNIIF